MIRCVDIQLCSAVYMILLLCVFVYKKKSKTLEGALYQVLLLLTSIILLLDIIGNTMTQYQDEFGIILNIIGKTYLILNVVWCMWLMMYVISINSEDSSITTKQLFKKSMVFKMSAAITLVISILICLLESIYIYEPDKFASYQSGAALYFTYVVSFVYMGIIAVYMINNPKKVTFAKRAPIFVFIFLATLSIVLQWAFPTVLLVSSVMAFVMLFMYFTMENPDLRIISELEIEKEEVEEASKAKTDFLSNMSHDIRTPMNAIIGFSESLLMEDLNEMQKGEIQNIYEAATTLLGIINNILDVSRIESGKEEKTESPYEFKKIIMQLNSVIASKIDSSKVKFNIHIDKDVPTHLIGDELKIYQILMNLLSNAVKYTEEGHIDFNISSENLGEVAKLKFVVSDTGIGIKESDYDKLFVKFSRINNQENYKSIEGTGLGLVITKKLIELLGGTITFVSEYGKGTSFTVILPQKIHMEPVESQVVSVVTKNATVANVHFDGSLYDILVVDDNDLNLKVAERILRDYKFQITLASSGEEAIQKLKDGNRYDLIFLDHMMPIMDGVQTLHNIRALEGVKIPPIVALTANAMVGMKEMYLNEGFDGYISKPINREELQVLLNNIFCKK
ncbi:MAG: response regulator [Firmicutes bacterium]|nr:response regulator [Bacillota bacterium]